VFSSLDWQLADAVMVYHLRNAGERLTELTQDEPRRPGVRCHVGDYLHVHEPTTTSAHGQPQSARMSKITQLATIELSEVRLTPTVAIWVQL